MRYAILFLILFLVVGCDGSYVRNSNAVKDHNDAVLKVIEDRAVAQEKAFKGLSDMATACKGEARCVEHVAAMVAMAFAAGGGGGQQNIPLATPPREPSAIEKFTALAGALSPLAATAVQGAVNWHQADTSRDVSLAQYGFLAGTVHDVAGAAASMQPSVSVGGDYVSGNGNGVVRGHVGDAIGGSVVGGDLIGRDRTDNQGVIHYGDGDRYGSPGPWTGPICEGEACQPTDSNNDGGAP